MGLRHLPTPTRYGAWLTLPLIVAFIWLGISFEKGNEADAAMDYFEAQPANNTVVFGCCVNEVVTYYHGKDDRLQLRLDMEQVVVVFNPNDDNVNKVLRDYEVDDLVKDCEYSERYHTLVIYKCEFEPPPED